jgi:hypothetical protein
MSFSDYTLKLAVKNRKGLCTVNGKIAQPVIRIS